MRFLRCLGLLTASLAFADVPASGCRSDAECVISDFQGCCPACCPDEPRAWLKSELEREERRCSLVDCARAGPCTIPCARPEKRHLVAVCVGGRCQTREGSQPNAPDFCAADADCVSSTFTSCCGTCCPASPVAVTRRRAQLEQQQCARVRCQQPACGDIACAQLVPAPIHPVCRANRCVAERTNFVSPATQCRSAADCGIDQNPPAEAACWSSPCGCCPSPRAVPIEQVRSPPVRRAQSKNQGAPFGLSEGTTQTTPSCGTCPAPSVRLSAGCTAGRCVLQPR
jgi:hypothetical protein